MSIVEIFPAEGIAETTTRLRRAAAAPIFPVIVPARLWLVQMPSDGAAPAPIRHAIDVANVVIYDRTLADAVAGALPIGNYAEPAGQNKATAARCVRFARDGWSVARLLPARLPQRERTQRVRDIVDEFAAEKITGRFPVTIMAVAMDAIEERFEARIDDLIAIADSYPHDTILAIAINAFGEGTAARFGAVAANGLAG